LSPRGVQEGQEVDPVQPPARSPQRGRSGRSHPALAMHKHTAWPTCLADRDRDCDRSGELSITARRAADMGRISADADRRIDSADTSIWRSWRVRPRSLGTVFNGRRSCRMRARAGPGSRLSPFQVSTEGRWSVFSCRRHQGRSSRADGRMARLNEPHQGDCVSSWPRLLRFLLLCSFIARALSLALQFLGACCHRAHTSLLA
jgi:hypothetical protein